MTGEDRIAQLERAIFDINDRIFAKGALLGSEDYFSIRQTCVDALGKERMGQMQSAKPGVTPRRAYDLSGDKPD